MLVCIEDSLFSNRIGGVIWTGFEGYFMYGYKQPESFASDKKLW